MALSDERELAELFRDEYGGLVRLAYLLVSDAADAEEIVQDAFLGLARNWNCVERPGGYLRSSVVNGCRSRLRRRDTARRHRLDDPEPVLLGADELGDALDGLSEPQRHAIVLTYYADLPMREVARLMGCPVPTAKSHLRRGLRNLRRALA